MDMQAFYTGHAFDAYEFFGAHTYFGGTHFAVWAPSAQYVQVVGEFGEYGMHRTCAGVWEADVNGADAGMAYQYRVTGANGRSVDHCDPYGFAMKLRPDGRSIIAECPTGFADEAWLAARSKNYDKPLNIYEVHMGSWQQKEDGSWYTYAELAELLPAYCQKYGYTHLELMPLAEHPFDGSWGYQTAEKYRDMHRAEDAACIRDSVKQHWEYVAKCDTYGCNNRFLYIRHFFHNRIPLSFFNTSFSIYQYMCQFTLYNQNFCNNKKCAQTQCAPSASWD